MDEEANDAASPVGVIETEVTGTPVASTLTTVSDETRDSQLASMRVEHDE